MNNEERLIKIETMLAHQDQHIHDLGEALELQRRDIAMLTRHLERMHAKIAGMDESAGGDDHAPLTATEQAARDKPPHY